MGSLANVAVVTLDSPSRSAACEQAAHFHLIRIVRLKPRPGGLTNPGSEDDRCPLHLVTALVAVCEKRRTKEETYG